MSTKQIIVPVGIPFDEKVWNAWVRKNREQERAFRAKWLRRIRTLLFAAAIAAAIYYFAR